ncbi:hypothetical protein CANCADRAFT_45110 [Tortispora caseinolytica NRRL Y-17796]|uniref:non-specific serine/threonine protein kinase n=1 Tax=Tortispora caseinolytica NRRL Y-17796 TaxID=767744 RepID=A0A1E4TA33_9ASCO|nr:hypothetical protein CANCADRAFT_45110 [Tortispora caseinolytica NRRL Y-17796]
MREIEDLTEERYELQEQLGTGSFGVVYKAIDRVTKEVYAIKQIDLESGDEGIEEIRQEILLLSECNSTSITRYHGCFLKGTKLWIVMEYMGGGSCFDLLKPGPFTELQIGLICKGILEGLVYLHARGKIHRDIKAANVLLSLKGEVKLADFGVAAQMSNNLSRRNTFVGTPFWMAPEVILQKGYNNRADIWSLGITAMELAQGEPPLSEYHPMKVLFLIPKQSPPRLNDSQFSPEFQDFVAKCLVKDPRQRPSAEQLLKHKFITNSNEVSHLTSLISRYDEWQARRNDRIKPKYYVPTVHKKTINGETNKNDDWDFTTSEPTSQATSKASTPVKPARSPPTRHSSKHATKISDGAGLR